MTCTWCADPTAKCWYRAIPDVVHDFDRGGGRRRVLTIELIEGLR